MRLIQLATMAAMLGIGACTPLDNLMGSIFGRSMRDQSHLDPYEHPLPPPPNTVPYSAGNFPAAVGEVNLGQPESLVDRGPAFAKTDVMGRTAVVMNLVNPVPPSTESLARGQVMFDRFCAPCHGADGSGMTGTIVPAGFPPFPISVGNAPTYPDGLIYGLIRHGGAIMPAYGHRISYFDRWHIVNYLRQIQGVTP